MVQVKSYLQNEEEVEETVYEEEEEEEEEEDEDEKRNLISHQCLEANNYFNQSSSPMQMPSPSDLTRSWSFQDDKETSNDSDSSPPPAPSQAQYYQDTRQSSSRSRPNSLEMELICDLRGHVEQLQQEMVGGKGRNSADRTPWKRSCCICYEMQVDSLLYRCGHMCTCLKCAHELLWSSGKCPMCRAAILDVVPAK